MVQDFTGSPSISTTHVPQLDVSQPQCVPVSPSASRRKCTSSRRGSTPSVCVCPLTDTVISIPGQSTETSGWVPDFQGGRETRPCGGSPQPTRMCRMFDKAMTKSVGAYLQPGEELLNATIVQGKGLGKVALAGGVFGAMAVASSRDRKAAKGQAEAGEVQLSS